MADDPLERARMALQRAQSVAREGPDAVTPILIEALRHISAGLEQLEAREYNLAVQQALLDDRLLRVERNRLFTAFNRIVTAGANLLQKVRPTRPAMEPVDPAAYDKWVAHQSATLPSVEQARANCAAWRRQPSISILIVARNGTASNVFQSLEPQAYEHWELCAAVSRAGDPQVPGSRAKLHTVSADGLDDAQALNAAASLATGEFLLVLPETGTLAPLALFYFAEALQEIPFDLLYCDEDLLDAAGRRGHPIFKPDWSPELLLSALYTGPVSMIRRASFVDAGGFSSEHAGAHLWDLALRLSDRPVRVHHISKVLFHSGPGPRASVIPEGARAAIVAAVARREKLESVCEPGTVAGTLVVRRKSVAPPMTAIVCSRSPKLLDACLTSLRATAKSVVPQIVVVAHQESGPDPELQAVIERAGAVSVPYSGTFHFAAMNNIAAALAEAPNLLFLNDDVRATQPGWAEWLSEQVSRAEVGVAGAVLWYPTSVIQHAGIVVGMGDGVGHVGRYMGPVELWPWLLTCREVSAVTGACFAIRKKLFDRVGGFDPLFPNNYNDVDLCFRVRAQGSRVVCVPVNGLIHAECQSRPGVVRFEERYRFYERWAELLRSGDPYYSPALAPTERVALNLNEDRWQRSLFASPRT